MLDVRSIFPVYAANSSGFPDDIARLAIETINQLPDSLASLAKRSGLLTTQVQELKQDIVSDIPDDVDVLRKLLAVNNSDKSTHHNYYLLYSHCLRNRDQIKKVFEIGLGTNNTDTVSHMNASGTPGASLRAFRDYLPNAEIYGADIDRRVLFQEPRIQTFYLDQTDPETFADLDIGSDFDLMIDDGLHAPNANINSLTFFLDRLRVGGWAVIEDIPRTVLPVWQTVSCLIPKNFTVQILNTRLTLIFVIQRIE